MKKAIILCLATLTLMSFSTVKFDNKPFIVIVDAGHGGTDPGMQKDGIYEKELTLSIAKKLRELGNEKEIKIILTRRNDYNLPLDERIDLTKDLKGDLFVSLHLNTAEEKSTSGIDCYVSPSNLRFNDSKEFSKILMTNFKTVGGIEVNETKTANFHILKKNEIPSVLLELGYLTNDDDFNFIANTNNQEIIAEKIFTSIQEYKKSK